MDDPPNDLLHEWKSKVDLTLDEARPEARARGLAKGYRTARENLEDLCGQGSFVEDGQTPRRVATSAQFQIA